VIEPWFAGSVKGWLGFAAKAGGNYRLRPGTRSAKEKPFSAKATLPPMPTYDYQCEKCKKTFEFSQSMKDPVLTNCPKDSCQQKTWGKGKVKRQLGTGAGLIFKGSGFYITDYRSEGYKAAAKKDAGGGTEAPAKSSESTAAKPAEKKTDATTATAAKTKDSPKPK
jgi:putative FmdB family regulatory protein